MNIFVKKCKIFGCFLKIHVFPFWFLSHPTRINYTFIFINFILLFFPILDDVFKRRIFLMIKYYWKSNKNYEEAIYQQGGGM